MLIFTHFVATTVILFLSKKILSSISLPITLLSYLFGVLIDLDHLILHRRDCIDWLKKLFRRRLLRLEEGRGDKYLHSVFQEPWFFFVLLLISVILFSFIKKAEIFLPAFCLGTHIFFDVLTDFDNVLLWPFSEKKFRGFIRSGSIVEILISFFLFLILFLFLQ